MPYMIKKSRYYYVDLWVPDKATPGAIHINKSTRCQDLAQAQEIEDDWRAEAEERYFKQSGHVMSSDLMLSDAAQEVHRALWQYNKTGDKSLRQVHTIIDLVGDMPLTDLSGAPGATMIEHIKRTLMGYSVAGEGKGRPIGPDTVDRYMAALKKVLNYFRDERMMHDLVIPKIKSIGDKRSRQRELFQHEERALFKLMRAGDPDYCDLFEFLLDTGLRVSEALALSYLDGSIRLAEGTIRVNTLKRKDNAVRTVHLTQRAKRVLASRQQSTDPQRPFPWNPTQVSHKFRQYRQAMGIDDADFVPHMLRHTCTTRLLDAGYPLTRVQAVLGHSNNRMTLYYNRGQQDGQKGAADILDKLQDDRPVVDPKDLEIDQLKQQIAELKRLAAGTDTTQKHHGVAVKIDKHSSRGIHSSRAAEIESVKCWFDS